MEIIKEYGTTKRVLINANSTTSLQDSAGEEIIVKSCAIADSPDIKTGDITRKGYLFTDTGESYGTISASAITFIDNLIDLMREEPNDDYTIRVAMPPAKSGRNFVSLTLV